MSSALTLNQISKMSLSSVIDAYNRGTRLEGFQNSGIPVVINLQTTCPLEPVSVGAQIFLTLTGSGGTAPYTHRFQKNGIDLSVITGVGEGVSKVYIYTISAGDVSPVRLSGTTTDACGNSPPCSRYCDIVISPPGTITPPPGTITPPPGTITPPPGTITPPPGTITPPPGTITPTPPIVQAGFSGFQLFLIVGIAASAVYAMKKKKEKE